jgi:hypothetical protein
MGRLDDGILDQRNSQYLRAGVFVSAIKLGALKNLSRNYYSEHIFALTVLMMDDDAAFEVVLVDALSR